MYLKNRHSFGKKTYNYIFMGKKGLEYKALLKSEQGQTINMFFS